MQTYWNKYGCLNAEGLDTDVNENTILYTAEYCFIIDERLPSFESYVELCYRDGRFFSYPYDVDKVGETQISHDNLTALVAYSRRFGLDWHIRIKEEMNRQWGVCYASNPSKEKRPMHPRDVIYYRDIKILYPLFLAFCTEIHRGKKKGDLWKTDGLLLNYVRFRYTKSFKYFEWLLSFHPLKNFKNVFAYYFGRMNNPNHPINLAYEARNKEYKNV